MSVAAGLREDEEDPQLTGCIHHVIEQLILKIGEEFRMRIAIWDWKSALVTGVFATGGCVVGIFVGGPVGAAVGAGLGSGLGTKVATMVDLSKIWETIKEKLVGLITMVWQFVCRLAPLLLDAVRIIAERYEDRRELALRIIDYIRTHLNTQVDYRGLQVAA